MSAARLTDRPADPAPEERSALGTSHDANPSDDDPTAPRLSRAGILLLFSGIGLEILSQVFSGIYPSGQIADRLASAGAGLFFSFSAILMVRRVTRRRSVLSAMILVASLFLFSKLLEVTGHVAFFREIPLLGGGHWLHKDLHSATFSLSMLLLLLTLFWMTYEAHRAEYLLKRSRQNALRLSESRYRLLAENATDVIWSCDNALRLTYVSPSMRRMFGWDPGMLLGKGVTELLAEEDRDKAAALHIMIGLASGGGDPPPCVIEAHHLTPDGPPVWAEIHASVARNDKGKPEGLTGSARDITRRKNDEAALRRAHEETEDRVRRRTAELRLEIEERRLAEAALRESEELFRMVFENAAEAVFWADAATGVLLLCNRAAEQLTGLPRAEIIGRHQAFLHPREEHELYRAMFGRHREGDSSPFDEGEIVTASGDRRAVQITHSAAEVRGRRIVQGVFRDITSRREAERIITEQQMQMISASRMSALGVMASGIAHEINNPLAVISMAAEQLAGHAGNGTCPPEVLERLAPMLGRNVDRIERIVRGLRNLSREGTRDPFARTQVGALVEDALELCRTRLMTHGIHLTVAGASDSMAVECRVTQISQVLLNLLNNAHDALDGSDEKWIRIEIEDEGDTVALAVCDSGPGVPDDLRERIMEPFFTTKEVGRGTGLGLSISKSIIEDHGGALLLDTTADCTRFVARLPKRQPR